MLKEPNWTWQNPLLVKFRGSRQLQAAPTMIWASYFRMYGQPESGPTKKSSSRPMQSLSVVLIISHGLDFDGVFYSSPTSPKTDLLVTLAGIRSTG